MAEPTLKQRLDACSKPINRHQVMYQKWRELLFLHWEFPNELIQKSLPEGLTVDTYEGKAYLGVVPFFMKDIRPRFLPAVPGISDFLELNLRTYVYDRHGRPGVWFYSLDANQWLAVKVARSLFNLPYYNATMSAKQGEVIDYKVSRKDSPLGLSTHIEYSGGEKLPATVTESLEFFLIERYLLFAANRTGDLFCGKVYHTPYQLKSVSAKILQEGTIALAGFEKPERPPEHAVMSSGVDVKIFAIEPVR